MPKKKKSKSSKKTAIFSDIQTQLKAINQKLDFVVVLLGYNDKEEPHRLVAEALKTIDDLEKQ